MIVTATFGLMDALVECQIEDGYYKSGTYTNPYPYSLNFQVINTKPRVGDRFIYMFELKPNKTDEPLPTMPALNVYDMYGKIMFPKG